jgi:hypothetical protein
MTHSQGESVRHFNSNLNELMFHILCADTGFHLVPNSEVGRTTDERYERSFQVELDETDTRIEVTGLLSDQQSRYVATIHLVDEGQASNPSTELTGAMSDGLLGELSGSIRKTLRAKQRRQSTNPPTR